MFKDLLGIAFPIIEKFAPTLASAIGSPVSGMAASWGISILAKAFGIDEKNIAMLPQAIANDDTSHLTLQKIEEDFGKWYKNNNGFFVMPSSMEVNIKMVWEKN